MAEMTQVKKEQAKQKDSRRVFYFNCLKQANRGMNNSAVLTKTAALF